MKKSPIDKIGFPLQIYKRYAVTCQQNRYGVEHQVVNGLEPAFCKRPGFMPLLIVCDNFLEEKTNELRADSMRSYRSFVGMFSKWINSVTNIEYFSMIILYFILSASITKYKR